MVFLYANLLHASIFFEFQSIAYNLLHIMQYYRTKELLPFTACYLNIAQVVFFCKLSLVFAVLIFHIELMQNLTPVLWSKPGPAIRCFSFQNIFWAAFMCTDPKSKRKAVKLLVCFVHSGSAHVIVVQRWWNWARVSLIGLAPGQ